MKTDDMPTIEQLEIDEYIKRFCTENGLTAYLEDSRFCAEKELRLKKEQHITGVTISFDEWKNMKLSDVKKILNTMKEQLDKCFTSKECDRIKTNIMTNRGRIELPCMRPILVPIQKIRANDYNPNHVDKKGMELLLQSVKDNGFCFPIVTVYNDYLDLYYVVDGFHRYQIFRDYLKAEEIPVVVLKHDMSQRMAATVQFNRARGVHQVELMSDLVRSLVEQGVDDDEISKHLGMDLEEVFRLKQITGIAELFAHQNYSKSWEMQEVTDGE